MNAKRWGRLLAELPVDVVRRIRDALGAEDRVRAVAAILATGSAPGR